MHRTPFPPIFHIEERDVLCVGPPLHGAYGCTSRLKLRLLIANKRKRSICVLAASSFSCR